MGSWVTELSPAQRASRGHQLACAFLLAYTRGDQNALIPVLEDAQSEIVDFCVSLAHAGTRLARETIGEANWVRFLEAAAMNSADLAADPRAQQRLDSTD